MVELIARVTGASDVAEAFLNTTYEQLRAAQTEEWGRVAELTEFRDVLMARLAEVTASPLSEQERLTLAQSLTRVQELDAEIRRRAEHEHRRLKDEMGEVEQARTVAVGYGWANGHTQTRIFDRYG
jgi:hypothetical protein